MGNLRRPNADDARETFNRSKNVVPILSFTQGMLAAVEEDVRSGWHRLEEGKCYIHRALEK